MLFLAVFCGFLAEYQLEHKIEKDRERQFIASLVSDLKDDTLSIAQQILNTEAGFRLFDSLSRLMESPETAKANSEAVYFTSRMGVRQLPLVNNSRTFDQLKNSGGFRLIHKQETSGRIMNYYSILPELRMLEEIFERENTAFKAVASRVLDQAVFRRQNNPDNSIARLPGPLPLLSYDPIDLKQLGFYAVQMNGSRLGMIGLLQRLKNTATELLAYLKETYRIRNE